MRNKAEKAKSPILRGVQTGDKPAAPGFAFQMEPACGPERSGGLWYVISGTCPEMARIPPFSPLAHTLMHLSVRKHFAYSEM